MTYLDSCNGDVEDHGCRCRCNQPDPVVRIHTPERLEACLVEGRFGVADFDVARPAST